MKTATPYIAIIFFALIVANIWQWHNPKVIELPAVQEEIDRGAWVQRAAYVSRGLLLDSLKAENEEMARRIRQSRDQIANLTTITGKLNLQVDSLESETGNSETWQSAGAFPAPARVERSRTGNELCQEPQKSGTLAGSLQPGSYYSERTFGSGLFRVSSTVTIFGEHKRDVCAISNMTNRLELEQMRDIRISVANTMSRDYSRLLTYVTSPDFEQLEYQTFTQLKPRRRTNWFLAGVGVGAVAVTGILILN